MNRETLDGIVKQGLFAYATSHLVKIGQEAVWDSEGRRSVFANAVLERERALKLLTDDAARLKIVDEILKEMK